MAVYEWRCQADECDGVLYSWPMRDAENRPIPECEHGDMAPVYSTAVKKSMPEHFNASVGTYVNNEREHRDLLKRQSEEMSLRTGMDHNFVPVDAQDLLAQVEDHDDVQEALDRTKRVEQAKRKGAKWVDASDLVKSE